MNAPAFRELGVPILDGGVRNVRYFNGRLLTAGDLRREGTAREQVAERLGIGIGDGVVFGLEVAPAFDSPPAQPALRVQRGLAINRCGEALLLDADIDVALSRTTDERNCTATFGPCGGSSTTAYVAGPGVYLLVLSPVLAFEGKAVISTLEGTDSPCNVDAEVQAVQLRLVQIDGAAGLTSNDMADEDRLRNRVAHEFLRSDALTARAADPFSVTAPKTLLDRLRERLLDAHDVPLAALYWRGGGGLRFVDSWSVRRRTGRPAATSTIPPLANDATAAAAEARLFQFIEHMQSLAQRADAQSLRAADVLRYLPPAGFLPLAGAGRRGLAPAFLGARASPIADNIDARAVDALLRVSFAYPEVDLSAGTTRFQLYAIRENADAVTAGADVQPALVYAAQFVPYAGTARFAKTSFGATRFARRAL